MYNSVQQNFRQNGGCRLVDNLKRNDQLRGRTAGQTWTDSTQSTDHLTAVRFGRFLEGRGLLHGKEESIRSQRALSVIIAAQQKVRTWAKPSQFPREYWLVSSIWRRAVVWFSGRRVSWKHLSRLVLCCWKKLRVFPVLLACTLIW